MSFIDAMKAVMDEDYNTSITENGAKGFRTTGKELLDLNFAVSSLRNKSEKVIVEMFSKAFFEDKLLAVKWLFFASDIRGGMGERRLFRICIKWLVGHYPNLVREVLGLIPEYNRWDNIIPLLYTDIKQDVLNLIGAQLHKDNTNRIAGRSVSLLAKWLPSANASSEQTKKDARTVIKGLGLTERGYRKILSSLRSYIGVVEVKMSGNKWEEINYSAVPSKANLIYNSAFLRHDEERRRSFLEGLTRGEEKINSGVLFPHEILCSYRSKSGIDTALEEMWKALPDYVKGEGSTICVADGSGSMTWSPKAKSVCPLDIANALAIYFAERCSGEFKDKYITFSMNPQLVDLSGGTTLKDRIAIANSHSEIANTNIEAVFDLILQTAIEGRMSQEGIPSNILILSDMEFDRCACSNNTGLYRFGGITNRLFDEIRERYEAQGYKLPRLIFWNICSRTGTIPVKENDCGVALVSGFSPTVMNMVLSGKTDPYECLLEQINSERYAQIEEAFNRANIT